MARHINMGEMTWFFYGQSYMGSLDAILIALGFRIFGEHVWVIRLVQLLLYIGFLHTGWLLARRVLKSEHSAGFAVLIMAVPPVVVTTYTSATLGGYGETLILGNLILLIGYEILFGNWTDRALAWIGLGLLGGLAFWTLGLSVVYLLPIVILGLGKLRTLSWKSILPAALSFFVGSFPWWLENLTNRWAALTMDVSGAPIALPASTVLDRLIGFWVLGLPTILGIRRPWEGRYEAGWVLFISLLIFIGVLLFCFENWRRKLSAFCPGSGKLLLLVPVVFFVVFVGMKFGVDSTGRYFLPLYPVYVIAAAAFFGWIAEKRFPVAVGLVAIMLGTAVWTNVSAARSPGGLTTQIDPISRFDNRHDDALMDFLRAENLARGYSNYWVTYRIAFLSREELIFSPRLPYKENLSYTKKDIRYPKYDRLADEADAPAFITTKHPDLDAVMEMQWAAMGVSYSERLIGPYHIYYDFSREMRPDMLDLEPSP